MVNCTTRKLENDLLRRNASTNGRKTDLIEAYILHRKPDHTIYVRYFSILLYLLNVQVASVVDNIPASALTTADRRPPSWNRITDSTHAPPVGNGIGEPH
jgi:hypothetical protein